MKKITLNQDTGLLIVRVVFGLLMVVFGLLKVMGGTESWIAVGEMAALPGPAVFWGAVTAFAELLGGLALVFGIWTRKASAVLAIVMLVAFIYHVRGFEIPTDAAGLGVIKLRFKAVWLALSHFVVYLLLMATGPGKYSLSPNS